MTREDAAWGGGGGGGRYVSASSVSFSLSLSPPHPPLSSILLQRRFAHLLIQKLTHYTYGCTQGGLVECRKLTPPNTPAIRLPSSSQNQPPLPHPHEAKPPTNPPSAFSRSLAPVLPSSCIPLTFGEICCVVSFVVAGVAQGAAVRYLGEH